MWRDYAAAKLANNYRLLLVAAVLAGAVGATCCLCTRALPAEREIVRGRKPDLIVSGPFGEYKIYGAHDWLAPVIEQGRRMNQIEAKENHSVDPTLSPYPEEY